MTGWQITHGQVRGAYLCADGCEVYVRQDGLNPARWLVFVEGRPIKGGAASEASARASAELLLRERVIRTKTSCMTAPTG